MEPPSCSGDPTPKRRRRRRPADGDHAGEDLLSALPDDLLIAVLERVDSRTAVSTSALSRRLRRLDPAGNLSVFEFSVATHLPPEYAAAVDLYLDARARGGGEGGIDLGAIAGLVRRCEDLAMAAYARGLACFLGAPDRCPRARSLRLELFVTPWDTAAGPETAACLFTAFPNLERLAIDAVPRAAAGRNQQAHLFPVTGLGDGPAALHVTNCLLCADGHGLGAAFPALTTLTVEITPRVATRFYSTFFSDLMRGCQQLVSLRLVSCYLAPEDDGFTVDLPPASRLRELIIETCNFGEVRIVDAPSLKRLVLERWNLYSIRVESAPRLETLVCRGSVPKLSGAGKGSLRFVELSVLDPIHGEYRLASFFKGIPNVEELTLRFRGRMIWVEREHSRRRFQNLKKLSINLPRLWSLHWMKQLLRVAPCLEKLHIHIFAPSSEALDLGNTSPCDETTVNFQHTYLKEIEMVGFEGAEQQMAPVRHFMTSCSSLKTVMLIRHHARLEEKLDRQGGIACPSWLMEDEKVEIISQLRHGIHSDAEIVLG
ncbi:hypothetical protein QOZ80_4AG0319250 [Eleusine coracana subsp. coracana]|nr:hypothetical protein QOZ80_4AG0319250 [Eleusine coracana subsp. coracana]